VTVEQRWEQGSFGKEHGRMFQSQRILIIAAGAVLAMVVLSISTVKAEEKMHSVTMFKQRALEKEVEQTVEGIFADYSTYQLCQEGAIWGNGMEEYLIISDLRTLSDKLTLAENEIFLHAHSSQFAGTNKWQKNLFTVKRPKEGFSHGPKGRIKLVKGKQLEQKPTAGDDVSVEIKEVVCKDNDDHYGCKPRIMKVIEDGDFALVKKMVQEGVDVNRSYPYFYGETALMHALEGEEVQIALYLLEQGADPTIIIRVPLFVQNEEVIKVDTRTGEYVSRVKE
jgi:hypothetical protein